MSQQVRRVLVYTFLGLATVIGITFSSSITPNNPAISQVVIVGAAVVIAMTVMSKGKNSGE